MGSAKKPANEVRWLSGGGTTLWSWRESNPRPDKETICFLHAYFVFGFHPAAENKHPTASLSAKFSKAPRSSGPPIPTFSAPLDQTP